MKWLKMEHVSYKKGEKSDHTLILNIGKEPVSAMPTPSISRAVDRGCNWWI